MVIEKYCYSAPSGGMKTYSSLTSIKISSQHYYFSFNPILTLLLASGDIISVLYASLMDLRDRIPPPTHGRVSKLRQVRKQHLHKTLLSLLSVGVCYWKMFNPILTSLKIKNKNNKIVKFYGVEKTLYLAYTFSMLTFRFPELLHFVIWRDKQKLNTTLFSNSSSSRM